MNPEKMKEKINAEHFLGEQEEDDILERSIKKPVFKLETSIEKEFDLIQLELLKQIRIVLQEPNLNYEKLGALVDTYEVLLGGTEE